MPLFTRIILGLDVHALLKLMSLNGQTKDAYSKSHTGGWRYDIVLPGFKMNMPDICAAIGLAQIKKYKKNLLLDRKKIAMHYFDRFKEYVWAILPPLCDDDKESSYHIFALRIMGFSEIQRDLMIQTILKRGVSVNVHFIPLPMLKFFKESGYDIDDYPNAYSCYCCEISLPIYPQLDHTTIDYIVDIVVESYLKVIKI